METGKRLGPEFAPGASPSSAYFVRKLAPYESAIGVLPILFFCIESLLAIAARHFYGDSDFMLKLMFSQLLAINCTMAGLLHFFPPMVKFYEPMIFLPFKKYWLYSTGIALVLGGLGLVFPRTQIVAAWCLVGVLLLMFAGNIACVLMEHPRQVVSRGSLLGVLLRLPFQFSFIGWALWFTSPPLSFPV